MNANINIEDFKEYALMRLDGDFNSAEDNENLLNSFRELSKKGYTAILVDLTSVIYLNSGSIGVLLSGNAILKKKDCKMILFGASDYLENIFNVTKLNLALDICRTYEEAIDSLKQKS
ncbi:anti-sigma factor antagonist [Bacteroidetes/Chlorobi group bacterium ChocPot_Mid]|nr:MAG: anti-sigma factor antagonist [Bacteroidetes/Chlorobi group bacterium ChocPot_Mid]